MNTFTLQAQVFYTDDTSGAVQSPIPTYETLSVGHIISYPSGFTQLGLDVLEPSKTPEYYEVWLKNGNNVIVTAKKRFYLRDPEFNEVDIWFQNSLGVVEAVALKTGMTHGIQIEKTEYQRFLPYDVSNTQHQRINTEAYLIDKFQVSTGYHSLKNILPYIDILISRHVWWLKDGKRIPITIHKGTFQLVKPNAASGQYDYALNFSFSKSFTNQVFSQIDD